jgi:hypothetical protein
MPLTYGIGLPISAPRKKIHLFQVGNRGYSPSLPLAESLFIYDEDDKWHLGKVLPAFA